MVQTDPMKNFTFVDNLSCLLHECKFFSEDGLDFCLNLVLILYFCVFDCRVVWWFVVIDGVDVEWKMLIDWVVDDDEWEVLNDCGDDELEMLTAFVMLPEHYWSDLRLYSDMPYSSAIKKLD